MFQKNFIRSLFSNNKAILAQIMNSSTTASNHLKFLELVGNVKVSLIWIMIIKKIHSLTTLSKEKSFVERKRNFIHGRSYVEPMRQKKLNCTHIHTYIHTQQGKQMIPVYIHDFFAYFCFHHVTRAGYSFKKASFLFLNNLLFFFFLAIEKNWMGLTWC